MTTTPSRSRSDGFVERTTGHRGRLTEDDGMRVAQGCFLAVLVGCLCWLVIVAVVASVWVLWPE